MPKRTKKKTRSTTDPEVSEESKKSGLSDEDEDTSMTTEEEYSLALSQSEMDEATEKDKAVTIDLQSESADAMEQIIAMVGDNERND